VLGQHYLVGLLTQWMPLFETTCNMTASANHWWHRASYASQSTELIHFQAVWDVSGTSGGFRIFTRLSSTVNV
jgi:hypothetical protein